MNFHRSVFTAHKIAENDTTVVFDSHRSLLLLHYNNMSVASMNRPGFKVQNHAGIVCLDRNVVEF